VQKFYDTLISKKTVELVDGDEKYIYTITGSKSGCFKTLRMRMIFTRKCLEKMSFKIYYQVER
jgi:hypothetical protein